MLRMGHCGGGGLYFEVTVTDALIVQRLWVLAHSLCENCKYISVFNKKVNLILKGMFS